MPNAMIVTRFAPSPTGRLHLGNLRAALFNWALARRAGGRFLLRMDDTDPERSKPEFAEAIREDLRWLGLTWDREIRQSERLPLHAAAAERLKAAGRLYPCWETPDELALRRRAQAAAGRPPVYDRAALRLSEAEKAALAAERAPHWRFRLEHGRVEWEDGVLGPTGIEAASLSDPVLIREDGLILYTLASVADDADCAITDVVRGADHVANTAVQIQLFAALGAAPPRFAHHALLTDPAGEPFSKRADALSLAALREAEIEPLALLSLLARLGSADPVEPRTSLEEIAAGFGLSRFGGAPTRLDPAELPALSARTLRGLPFAAVRDRLPALGIDPAEAAAAWDLLAPNLDRLSDLREWLRILREGPDPEALEWLSEEDRAYLAEAAPLLPERPWDETSWATWTAACKAATGRKGAALYRPLRVLLTGRRSGPEMAALMPRLRGGAPLSPEGREPRG